MAFARFVLAERLGKTVAEIETMTVEELNGWAAYDRIVEKRRREAAKHKPGR